MQSWLRRRAPIFTALSLILLVLAACAQSEQGAETAAVTVAVGVTTPAVSPNPAPTEEAVAQPRRTPTSITASPTTPTPRTIPTATPPVTPRATSTPTRAIAAAPLVTPPPTPTPTPPGARVGRIATARTVDGLQRPLDLADEFDFGERVYVTVEFRDVREGAVLGFRWSSPAGCGGSYGTPPQRRIRRGFYAFFVDDANCPGPYQVDITIDGESVGVTGFAVRSPAADQTSAQAA